MRGTLVRVLAVGLLCGLLSAFCPAAPKETPRPRVTLEIPAGSDGYAVGDRVELSCVVTNRSKDAVWGTVTPLTPHLGDTLSVSYRRPSGEFVRFLPRWVDERRGGPCGTSRGLEVLGAGESAHGVARLFYNTSRQELVLDESGVYEFKAEMPLFVDRHTRNMLTSNVVRIEVKPATGPAKDAVEALRHDPELAGLIEGDWNEDPMIVRFPVTDAAGKTVESLSDRQAHALHAFAARFAGTGVSGLARESLAALVQSAPGDLSPDARKLADTRE
jgi:hypothetical protein